MPIQVKRFALEPVGAVPDIDNRFDDGWIARAREDPQTQSDIVLQGQQVIDDRETIRLEFIGLVENDRLTLDTTAKSGVCCRVRQPLVAAVVEVVDAAHIHEHLETERPFVA